MANEWVPVELYGTNNEGDIRRYTIADGTAVSKGQILFLSDPRTVSLTHANIMGGVASEDHKANVGVTSIGAWTNGVFEAVASGAIACGAPFRPTDFNKVAACPYAASGAMIGGYVLEDCADAETVNVRLML